MAKLSLIAIVFIASLGGLLAGYDTGIISGALLYINDLWRLSDTMQGVLVSSVLIGAVLGAAVNGVLADIYGRRKIMLLCGLIFIAGSIFCGFAPNIHTLIFSRMLVGFAIGAVNFVAPLYLAEMSPKEHRGMIISLYQWAITGGILFSYFISAMCANLPYNWRLMLLAGALPGFVLFIGMYFLKDTPRWLLSKNREDEARDVLEKIDTGVNVSEEIKDIKSTLGAGGEKFVFKKRMLMPFVIGIGIMFTQICTGINNVIYYAPTIFKTLGFASNLNAIYATVGVGVVNFLTTIIAVFTIDKIGRKPLLYIGLGGMALSMFALSFTFLPSFAAFGLAKWFGLLSVAFYIFSFAISLGPAAFILMSEVFPLKIRGVAMSVCILANYAFNFLVAASFPMLLHRLGGHFTFNIFAAVSVLCIFFVFFMVPETKGISLEDIEQKWAKGVKPREF